MEPFNRYDKHVIEPFALRTISKSFSEKYTKYFSPKNSDNFDYISDDGISALEITTVIPQNVLEAYKYEKILNKGNKIPSAKTITNPKIKDDGSLFSYYGGNMQEIKLKILEAIHQKQEKAIKRISGSKVVTVDLCVCLQDGCLFDLQTFKFNFLNFNESIFENIFFITPAYFIRYNKESGFSEYERKI